MVGAQCGNRLSGGLRAHGIAGALHEIHNAIMRRLGLGERLLAPFQHRTIMRGSEGITHHPSAVVRHDSLDGKAGAQRFAHLLALGGHPCQMHPTVGESPAGGAGLRHLVLMMREAQVKATAMDVEFIAQIAVRHRGAFQMPARAPIAEWRMPAGVQRIGCLGRLPQREIAGIVLVGGGICIVHRIVFVGAGGVHGGAHAIGHLGILVGGLGALLLMRELAVGRPAGNVEIHIAAGGAICVGHHIGVTAVDEALHEVDHVVHVAGGARFVCGRDDTEGVVGVAEFALVMVSTRPPALTGGGCLVKDFVVDVGHVADERDVVAELREPTADHIEGDGCAQMADVG